MAKPVRERLREDLEARYGKLLTTLEDALVATKQVWVNCPHCKRKSTVEVSDTKSALQAAEFFANQGFGRPAVSEPDDREGFVFENKVVLVSEEG